MWPPGTPDRKYTVTGRGGWTSAWLAFATLSRGTVTGIYFASERDIGDGTRAAYRWCGLGYARSNDTVINMDLDDVADMRN
jgi:hypothetical protein